MSKNLQGATVNGAGTKIATAKALGTSPVNTAVRANDNHTTVKIGNMDVPIKAAIEMGYLQRDSSGTLVELNGPVTPTRVG